eukprot:gb/GFBE01062161.1/.p1 GENE.gb/GFBE01062161.1/~~gb/GFBE01062161.1/.p1  ORF type:complete len:248 (+),score=43.09 gb/GFBE01062161.1/:1-744(+)
MVRMAGVRSRSLGFVTTLVAVSFLQLCTQTLRCWAAVSRLPAPRSERYPKPQVTAPDSAQQTGTSSRRALLGGGVVAALAAISAAPARAANPYDRWKPKPKVNEDFPDGNPVAVDLRTAIPLLPEEEVKRRRTTSSELLKDEKWFKQSASTFETRCAGCHALNRDADSRLQNQLLTLDYLENKGGVNDDRIRYTIRYGKGDMPGFAADCEDLNDNFAAMCRSIIPLSEEKLRDIQDWVINRANSDWK